MTTADASRTWRSMWRVHFYSATVAMPILVLLAITGLVIMYTDPIQGLLDGGVTRVTQGDGETSLDRQLEAVLSEHPDATVSQIATSAGLDRPTVFRVSGITDDRLVFVDPYTADVLGERSAGWGLVGLANRLHASLNSDSASLPLPSLAGLVGDGPALLDVPIAEIALEVFAGWGLVLAATGFYLWCPRRARDGQRRPPRTVLLPRAGRRGRARWRDLHAVPGLLLSGVLTLIVVTGMPWSAYWGVNWASGAQRIAPDTAHTAPLSAPEDHRAGHDAAHGDPGSRVAVSLNEVAKVAAAERLLPGYLIVPPRPRSDPAGNPLYEAFELQNPWPARTQEFRRVYVDQFTGELRGRTSSGRYGAVPRWTDMAKQTHVGAQYGIVNRVVMTFGCVAVLWGSFSGLMMWWRRRRGRGAGLPRRPADVAVPRSMAIAAVVLAVIYPLWGVSLLVALGLDRFVIRRVEALRSAFGMRDSGR